MVALEYLAVTTTIAAIYGYSVHISELDNLALCRRVLAHNLTYGGIGICRM